MSSSVTSSEPRAAYVEDCEDDDLPSGPLASRQCANYSAKRASNRATKETSDSGYSSLTTPSTSSAKAPEKMSTSPAMDMLRQQAARMKKKMSTTTAEEEPRSQRHVSKKGEVENLRVKTSGLETREEAARMKLAGPDPTSSYPRPVRTPVKDNRNVRPSLQEVHTMQHAGQIPAFEYIASGPKSVPRPRPTSTQSAQSIRPQSFIGSLPLAMQAQSHVVLVEYRPTTQPVYAPQPYTVGSYSSAQYIPTPTATSPSRQVAYPFAPTTMSTHYTPPSHGWPSDPYIPQNRRYSMTSQQQHMSTSPYVNQAPPAMTFQQAYPLPRRMSTLQGEHPRYIQQLPSNEESIHNFDDDDFDVFVPGSMMPPPRPRPTSAIPQRPSMPHHRTASDIHHAALAIRQSKTFTEPHLSRSPEQHFYDMQRPSSRPGVPKRNSITSSIGSYGYVVPPPEVPSSPLRSRRRSISYYGQTESDQTYKEMSAEAYQATKGLGQLSTDELYLLQQRHKSRANTLGSDAGSRGGSSRDGSDAKHSKRRSRASLEKPRGAANGDDGVTVRWDGTKGVEIEMKGGQQAQTINIQQSSENNGMQLTLGGRSDSTKPRTDSRATNRSSKKYHQASSANTGEKEKDEGELEVASRLRINAEQRQAEATRNGPPISNAPVQAALDRKSDKAVRKREKEARSEQTKTMERNGITRQNSSNSSARMRTRGVDIQDPCRPTQARTTEMTGAETALKQRRRQGSPSAAQGLTKRTVKIRGYKHADDYTDDGQDEKEDYDDERYYLGYGD